METQGMLRRLITMVGGSLIVVFTGVNGRCVAAQTFGNRIVSPIPPARVPVTDARHGSAAELCGSRVLCAGANQRCEETALSSACDRPAIDFAAAARFLDQATFGPTAVEIARLRRLGFAGWFAQQLAAPASTFPPPPPPAADLPNPDNRLAQARFLYNAMNGPDQLRQRMAFALGQIWVISGLKIPVEGMEAYLQLLQDSAFANYRDVMQAVTLSPSMGRYLDMANNAKAHPRLGSVPNENYARELLQLFTIGTVALNLDGTPQRDAQGNTIPTYQQADIATLARVFTGWTYPSQPGQPTNGANPPNFAGQMVPVAQRHDTDAKVVFGRHLPAGQSAERDLSQALDIIFHHPNVPPFVALRLIQHFVTSNPTPSYVQRVATVFLDNGKGVRGDLAAMIRAVLLDPEARAGDTGLADRPPSGGHLREPVLYATAVLRALGAGIASSNTLAKSIAAMGQILLFPPSVFNYYSPFYRIPGSALDGPEFELLTPSTAVRRANFVYAITEGRAGEGVTIDLSPFSKIAGNIDDLLTAVDLAFTRGQMPPTMRTTIAAALSVTRDPAIRARTAVYLAATASFYQVVH